MIKLVQESITSPSGCLFPYRNLASGETDFEGIWRDLIAYWDAVKQTFPEAWGKSPSKSRLMHGAGLRSMGRLMDRVDGWILGFWPRYEEKVERSSEYAEIHSDVGELFDGAVQGAGLESSAHERVIKCLTRKRPFSA